MPGAARLYAMQLPKEAGPARRTCEVCGAAPLERVLYPVAVHFKGSGFYSTDYGRGSRKQAKEGESCASSDGGGGDSKPDTKKAAEA